MATPSIPANCLAVTNSFISESGRFGPGIFARASRKAPIIGLMSKTRGAWANGMGVSVSAITFERSFPSLHGSWNNIGVSDGADANSCLPTTETVGFGQTARTYQPQHQAIDTTEFCIRDIQTDWQFSELLAKTTAAFGNLAETVWGRRYTAEYVRLSGHKYTLTKTWGEQESTTIPAAPVAGVETYAYNTSHLPSANLSQGFLNAIYMDLYREGADLPSGIDENTQEPVFTLLVGSETSKRIILDNDDIRTDNRYAYMGKGEMTPNIPGMPTKRKNYGGYVHTIVPYPRRFTFAGGAYVEIDPWVSSATTKGTKWEQNPLYKVAPFEETIVWHEATYTSLAVNTVTQPAPGWTFNPHDWMGQFEPRNILHKTCNPDGTMIYFRALFADASKPGVPQVGHSVLHTRCGIDTDLSSCTGT